MKETGRGVQQDGRSQESLEGKNWREVSGDCGSRRTFKKRNMIFVLCVAIAE